VSAARKADGKTHARQLQAGLTPDDEISATVGDPLAPSAGKREFFARSGKKFRLLI
jgi:hypothetical protein